MEVKLTRDAEFLACALYKQYKENRKSGLSKEKAMYMHDSKFIHENLMPEWLFDDVDNTCRELSRAGFLNVRYGDNVVHFCSLTNDLIYYMEIRFVDGIIQIIEYMGKIKSAIFF